MANAPKPENTEAEKPVASTIVISGQTVNVRTFKAGRVVIDLPADFMKGGTGPRWIPVGGLNPDGLQVFMTCGITRKEPKAPRE